MAENAAAGPAGRMKIFPGNGGIRQAAQACLAYGREYQRRMAGKSPPFGRPGSVQTTAYPAKSEIVFGGGFLQDKAEDAGGLAPAKGGSGVMGGSGPEANAIFRLGGILGGAADRR